MLGRRFCDQEKVFARSIDRRDWRAGTGTGVCWLMRSRVTSVVRLVTSVFWWGRMGSAAPFVLGKGGSGGWSSWTTELVLFRSGICLFLYAVGSGLGYGMLLICRGNGGVLGYFSFNTGSGVC
ncbi:hypothetical protein QBC39DRAFT_102404 [Podospora conica]|nr:hypothetical protein QBC39DRAFT_102404 [Schizothecium conicum]